MLFSLENFAALIFEYSTNCNLVYFAFGPITHRIIFELPRDLCLEKILDLQLLMIDTGLAVDQEEILN